MLKKLLLIMFALVCLGITLNAETVSLINFSELPARGQEETDPTLVDFSDLDVISSVYSEEQKDEMRISLSVENWEIILNQSANSVENRNLSYARAYNVKDESSQFPGEQVLGARLHFPGSFFNAVAIIKPPFAIPSYSDHPVDGPTEGTPGAQFLGRGSIRNVGTIKSLSANLYGRRFPYRFIIELRNDLGEVSQYNMGSLNFEGWRKLTWANPKYIEDVKKREVSMKPIYPYSVPSVSLHRFLVQRDTSQFIPDRDAVFYIRDVSVTYDKAVNDNAFREIDDEAIWEIIAERAKREFDQELKRLALRQEFRYHAASNQHNEAQDAGGAATNDAAAAGNPNDAGTTP